MTQPDPRSRALDIVIDVLVDVGLLPGKAQTKSDRIRERALARARRERSRSDPDAES
jgi:hypothetical protein